MRQSKKGPGTRLARLAVMLLLAGGVTLVLLSLRGEAQACGGLFCNRPPPNPFDPLPVAQNGENVVFFITKDPAGGAPTLEAHIQILYTGDAAKFSWVVPVDAEPKLSTGTDRLFTQLANVTQPRFSPRFETVGTCLPPPPSVPGAAGATGAAGAFGSATGSGGAGGSSGGVSVLFQGAVGPFDAAVIKSDDPVELKKWLSDNEYIVTDAAGALIDVYVREHKFFVALKLLNGLGVRSIQPIVLTFRGPEACVPLRLTAIAANPDMPVLVWVFAQKRAVPRGFYELKIDEARIDWFNRGSNYFGPTGLVSQAANEVGGNAFVAEYAGPASIARSIVYINGQIDLTQLRMSTTPPAYLQQLASMGLSSDPAMLGLLAKFIPMPEAAKSMNITEAQFYGNIGLYWNQFAFPTYDLNRLTDAISASIVEPRLHAQMMIDAQPYLTRLNTYLSPAEMDKDAFFFESKDLGDVPTLREAAIRTMCGDQEYMSCNAPMRLDLKDGRMLWIRAGSKATTCQKQQPDVVTALPAAEIAWAREEVGEGARVVDNTAVIQAGISAHNAKYPAEQTRYPIPTGAAGSAGTGVAGTAGTTGSSGAAGTGGGLTGAAGADGLSPRQTNGGGCGCRIADDATGAPLGLGLLALATISRRRRRGGAR